MEISQKNTRSTFKQILLLCLFLLALPQLTLAAYIQDYSPISHWTKDEESGIRYDSTTNSNDLADNNTVGTTTGLRNLAGDFESTNSEYLSLADASQYGLDFTTAFSCSLWTRPESLSSDHFLISKGDVNSGSRDVAYWFFLTSTGQLEFRASDDGTLTSGHNINRQTSTGVFTHSTNYHIVLTFDVATEDVKLYKNGSSVSWNVSGGSMGSTLRNSTDRFNIGGRENAGSIQSTYDGWIDEVTCFDYVLTSTEVSELYNAGTPLAYGADPVDLNYCIYATIDNMQAVSGQTCTTAGATTTCTYDLSATTTLVQVTSGDLVLILVIILTILLMGLTGFIIKPFTRK